MLALFEHLPARVPGTDKTQSSRAEIDLKAS
jgi:hypothetical protein